MCHVTMEISAYITTYINNLDRVLGMGLIVAARSEDGIVEALERVDGGFGLFVQWHPELTDDIKHRDAIFSALVRASAPRK